MAEGVVANEINRTILESSNISDEQQTTNLPKKKKMVKRKPARKQVSFIFLFTCCFLLVTLTDHSFPSYSPSNYLLCYFLHLASY